ncbi:glycosyltransferase [Georgenia sp. SUBG003]|uniref:glycosyltransferase n=1 Tax=Georgenia sp. SUBG003 TaxID=1497974 RepID=UPI003AB14600
MVGAGPPPRGGRARHPHRPPRGRHRARRDRPGPARHREDVLAVGTGRGRSCARACGRTLGGTDPALGPFGDGLELSRRARLAGHRVVVVPTAVVHHARASYL